MKKPVFLAGVFVAYSAIFFLFLGYSEGSLFFKRLSHSLQDILFKVRYASEPLPPSREQVVVVAVDDESCSRLDLRWPWPRRAFASIVEALHKQGASAIALNFSFTGYESGEDESTRLLAETMAAHGRVVVGATLDKDKVLKPAKPFLNAGIRYGYLEKIVDDDFVIRRSYLRRPYRTGGEERSFPLELWRLRDASDQSFEDWAEADGSYRINYLLKETDFKTVSAWKILQGRLPGDLLRGKTVLVGITSSLLAEKHQTPLGLLSGVAVHGNEWVSLEERRSVHPVSSGALLWAAWAAGAVLMSLFWIRRAWIAAAAYAAVFFLLFWGAQILLSKDVLLPIFQLLLGPGLSLIVGVFSVLLFLFLENRGLEKKVWHDKMTGLYTYDYLRLRLDDEWKRCQRFRLPVSIAMTDLDRFKKINDTLGHETGNQMIMNAAGVIRESVRGYDVVSRYGGDEFVVLLWHATQEEALAYRGRLRSRYETMAAGLSEPLLKASSISIGVATYDPNTAGEAPKNPQELIERADKDLFEDKSSRRKPGEDTR